MLTNRPAPFSAARAPSAAARSRLFTRSATTRKLAAATRNIVISMMKSTRLLLLVVEPTRGGDGQSQGVYRVARSSHSDGAHSSPIDTMLSARRRRPALRLEVPFFLLRIADMGCLHWLKRPFNGLGPRKSPSFQSAECPEWFPEWFPMKSNPNESNDYCSKISCAYLIAGVIHSNRGRQML